MTSGPACRTLGFVTMIAALSLLAGCLIIPVSYYPTGSRHNVAPGTTDVLHPGVTTKEELLLMLGEPDFVSEDGQRLGYAWRKIKVVFLAQVSSELLGRRYLLEASFDAHNRLVETRLLKEWEWFPLPLQ